MFRINKPKGHRKSSRSANNKTQEELESDEGLALLIPDIQETANLVQVRDHVRVINDVKTEFACNVEYRFYCKPVIHRCYFKIFMFIDFLCTYIVHYIL